MVYFRGDRIYFEAEWDESQHPRGKTTEPSTPGSFAPAGNSGNQDSLIVGTEKQVAYAKTIIDRVKERAKSMGVIDSPVMSVINKLEDAGALIEMINNYSDSNQMSEFWTDGVVYVGSTRAFYAKSTRLYNEAKRLGLTIFVGRGGEPIQYTI